MLHLLAPSCRSVGRVLCFPLKCSRLIVQVLPSFARPITSSSSRLTLSTTGTSVQRFFASARVVKSSPRLRPSRQALTLTPAAVQRIRQLLVDRPDAIGMRIGVRQRGCNGFTYTLDYATKKEKFDECVPIDDSTAVGDSKQNPPTPAIFIDYKAQLTLLGSEMDYQTTKMSSEFVFHNPNIKGTCGCGESFNV